MSTIDFFRNLANEINSEKAQVKPQGHLYLRLTKDSNGNSKLIVERSSNPVARWLHRKEYDLVSIKEFFNSKMQELSQKDLGTSDVQHVIKKYDEIIHHAAEKRSTQGLFSKFLVLIGLKKKRNFDDEYKRLKLQQPFKAEPQSDARPKAAVLRSPQQLANLDKSFVDAIKSGDAALLEETILEIFENPHPDKYEPRTFLKTHLHAIFSNLMILPNDKQKACIKILETVFEDTFNDAVYTRIYELCNQNNAKDFRKLAELFPESAKAVKELTGETPLLIACRAGDFETFKQLVDQKNVEANINIKNDDTPLHVIAKFNGSLEIAKFWIDLLVKQNNSVLLFEWENMPELANQEGKTPLELARAKGNQQLIEMLEKAAKKLKYDLNK